MTHRLGVLVMAVVLVVGAAWGVAKTPTVEYRGGKAVQCIVARPDANGVNALLPSDPRCKAIIKGFHFSDVVD